MYFFNVTFLLPHLLQNTFFLPLATISTTFPGLPLAPIQFLDWSWKHVFSLIIILALPNPIMPSFQTQLLPQSYSYFPINNIRVCPQFYP